MEETQSYSQRSPDLKGIQKKKKYIVNGRDIALRDPLFKGAVVGGGKTSSSLQVAPSSWRWRLSLETSQSESGETSSPWPQGAPSRKEEGSTVPGFRESRLSQKTKTKKCRKE